MVDRRENLRKGDNFEDLSVDGRLILNVSSRSWMGAWAR